MHTSRTKSIAHPGAQLKDEHPFPGEGGLQNSLNRAARILRLTEEVKSALLSPQKEVRVNIFTKMDNGTYQAFQGYRTLHCNLLGPYEGPIAFSICCPEAEGRKRALLRTLSASLTNTPMGGAYGGVQIDPALYSAEEQARIIKGFIKSIKPCLDSVRDIPWVEGVEFSGQDPFWIKAKAASAAAAIETVLSDREGSLPGYTGIQVFSDSNPPIVEEIRKNLEYRLNENVHAEPLRVYLLSERSDLLKIRELPEGFFTIIADVSEDSCGYALYGSLSSRVTLIPAFLCRAGASIAAYQRWLKEKMTIFSTDDDILNQIKAETARAAGTVISITEEMATDFTTAAAVEALNNLSQVLRQKGLEP